MLKRLSFTMFLGVVFFTFFSCEKNPTESSAKVPELATSEVTDIGRTSATCGGTISSDGGSTITAKGVCWSTGQTPKVSDNKTNDGTGAGSFESEITGLTAGTNYYMRAYATNNVGTGYGSAMSFTTEEVVTDIDGNTYQTVKIGDQWWMVENLKVTHYRNGNTITNVTENTAWSGLNSGAYCNYDNDANNATTYGRLYNWYAVNDSRNIAPAGWHVPTDAEWQTLVDYLGGKSVAGGKMKETGTVHWFSPNTGATNASGFSALPGGYRPYPGQYSTIGSYGSWWSATEYYSEAAWARDLYYGSSDVARYYTYEQNGFSVRCVKD